MGFFAGVVQQLNTIDERNERFAKEERDRAERRKELQDALKEKRMAAIIAAAASRGLMLPEGAGVDGTAAAAGTVTEAGGLTKDTGSKPSTSAIKGHSAGILIKDFKADPDLLAPFAALGESHMKEIYDAVDTVRKTYDDAGRLAEFTPDVVNNVLKGVRVTVSKGGTVYYEDLLKMAGLDDIPAEDRKYMDLMLQRGGGAKVTIIGQKPQFPLKVEEITKVRDAATTDLTVTLNSLRMDMERKIQDGTATPAEVSTAADLTKAIEQIDENEGNVPMWVIKQFGATSLAPYIANDPRISRGNLGGAWDIAKSRVFATEAELSAAFDAGGVKMGDTVVVGGKSFILSE